MSDQGLSKEQLKKRYYGLVVQQLQKGASPESLIPRLTRSGFSNEEAQEMINSALAETGKVATAAAGAAPAPAVPPVAPGTPVAPAAVQVASAPAPAAEAGYDPSLFAGFGPKLVAMIVDNIIITFISLPPIMLIGGLSMTSKMTGADPAAAASSMATMYLISFAVYILYFTILEGGSKHSTFGKRIFGLAVVTGSGDPVTFVRAGLRCLASFISGAILALGYLISIFTPKKQSLHDLITDTLVIKIR